MAVQKPFIDIDRFDPDDKKLSLSSWLENIQLCAELTEWPLRTIVRLVKTRALGTAGRRLDALQDDYASIQLLVADVRKLLSKSRDPRLGFQQLVRSGQRPGENLQDLADRVRKAVKDMNDGTMNEPTAINIFTSALNQGNTRMHVSMNEKDTLQQTMEEAIRFERRQEWAFANSSDPVVNVGTRNKDLNTSVEPMEIDAMTRNNFQRSNNFPPRRPFTQPRNDQQQSSSRSGDMECYYCMKSGHMSTECATRAAHMEMLRRFDQRLAQRSNRGIGRGGFRGRGRGRGLRPPGRVQELELSEADRQLREFATLLDQDELPAETFEDDHEEVAEDFVEEADNPEDFQ